MLGSPSDPKPDTNRRSPSDFASYIISSAANRIQITRNVLAETQVMLDCEFQTAASLPRRGQQNDGSST